jgi:hypothetical protein
LPVLIAALPVILTTIIEFLMDGIPKLIETGIQLLEGIVFGIMDAIPMLLEALPMIIDTLINFLVNNIPEIIQTGIEMIIGLVKGLIEALPMIVEMGIELVMNLIFGLLEALPKLITAAIDLVISLVKGIGTMLPMLIETGVELIISLVEGLLTAIPEIIKAIPQIIMALVRGIASLLPEIVRSGSNIIRSLWDGIQRMGQWLVDGLWNLIAGAINTIIRGVNSVLGLIGIRIPELPIRTRAEDPQLPNVSGVEDVLVQTENAVAHAAAEAMDVVNRAANETSRVVTSANDELLRSARAAAGGRMEAEQSVTRGTSDESRERERIARDEARELERIARENANDINRLGDDLTRAIRNQHEDRRRYALQAIDDEMAALRSANWEKMSMFDEEFAMRMMFLGEEEQARLGVLQAEIDAINERTRAEDAARREQEFQTRLAELQARHRAATTTEEAARIQQEVNRLVDRRQQEITRDQRNQRISDLRQQMDVEREHINEMRQTLESAKWEQLQAEREAQEEHFNELMNSQNLQMQALQTMLSESQEDMLALLDSYNPGWRTAGMTFSEMLSQGIADGQRDVEQELMNTLALLNNFQPTLNAPQIVGGGQLPDNVQGNMTSAVGATHDARFADDMRSVLTNIHDTINAVTQAVQQVARDTFAAFNNPLQAEFQGMRHMLDNVVSAIHGLRSLLSEPRVVLTNNFHGVTAPDVPHLVDRQNTALLRALGAM